MYRQGLWLSEKVLDLLFALQKTTMTNLKNFMSKVNCNPLTCMTIYLIILTTMLNFALSPIKEDITEVKTQVEKIRDLLTIKPQQIISQGKAVSASDINYQSVKGVM